MSKQQENKEMKIITLIPFQKGIPKDEFSYFSSKNITNGSIVSIWMRNKKILGLVINSEKLSNEKYNIKEMPFVLKKIDKIKEEMIFKKELIFSLLSFSKYFVIKKNIAFSFLIPNIFINQYDKIAKIKNNFKKENEKENYSENVKIEKLLFQNSLEDRISFYKTLIRSSFAQKKSIFIILPTQKDILNFESYLSKGIEKFIFKIHGNLSPKKQLEQIEKILTNEHPIVILGTAPFLTLAREDIKTIILEKESSNSYKTIKKPYLDLRIFAEIFAFHIKAKFILADTFLRFESIARREIDNFSEISPLSFRINFNGEIIILNKKESNSLDNLKDKKFKILTNYSIQEIKENLKNKKNVFIFSLRKGLATMTICNDCSEVVMCDKCNAPVVLYQTKDKKKIFICNKCNSQKSSEITCANCNSWNLISLGIGTDRVLEEITKIFPNENILKIDKENVKTNKQAEEIIKNLDKNPGSILIGTEMALFYLNKKIALSIIASFDSLWSIPNFRMSEKIIQTINKITEKTEEKLIIETKNEEDEILNAIKIDNLTSFTRNEIRDRKILNYPPYKRFIKISFSGNKEENVKIRKFLLDNFNEYNPEIFNIFLTKFKEKFITNLLIKIEIKNWSLPEITDNSIIDLNLFNKLSNLPNSFLVNIDPEDFT